jgi:hypothetical protein
MKTRSLLRGAALWTVLAVMGLAQGCGPKSTGVAVIKPDAQVRRLSAAVFAGDSQPLPELTNNNFVTLPPGGMVTTNAQGEAEVKIQDCLSLFVFQNGSLQRSTCRRSDALSGLAACSSGGMIGVLNNCTSMIDIQTPSSSTITNGTWFSVIYLPEDQLSIVQVYDGKVNVRAVIDPGSDEWAADSQQLAGPGLWFTAPGSEPPVINGITGRQARPLDDWQALRAGLIDRYPDLDMWMGAIRQTAGEQGLPFPANLGMKLGEINSRFVGQFWADDRIQRAFELGLDWKTLVETNWPQFNVFPSLLFQKDTYILDARKFEYNRDEALKLLSETGFYRSAPTITITAREENTNAVLFARALHSALLDLDINTELLIASGSEFGKIADYLTLNPDTDSPYIWIDTGGEAFSGN